MNIQTNYQGKSLRNKEIYSKLLRNQEKKGVEIMTTEMARVELQRQKRQIKNNLGDD
ncbi:hypothetical protein GOV10_05320 [Candidatus Woesearchaeota archaeon]|nr:hypothetical protein [Candidatus Woesearchaeota archaeon]